MWNPFSSIFRKKNPVSQEKQEALYGPSSWGSIYGMPVPTNPGYWTAYYPSFYPLLMGRDPWSWKAATIRTLQDVWRIRQFSKLLVETNPYAAGLVKGLCAFVCGEAGWDIQVMPKTDNSSKRYVKKVQEILDEFAEENDLESWYDEKFWRDCRDGETFLQLWDADVIQLRAVEPDQLAIPNGQPAEGEWSMGCRHRGQDYQDIVAYCVQYFDNSQAVFSAEDICHSKVNVPRNVKRGISEFYPVWELLNSSQSLLWAWQEGSKVRESIAYVQQSNSTQPAIQQLNAQKQTGTMQTWDMVGGSQTTPVQKLQPGTVASIPNGMEFKDPPKSSEGAEAAIRSGLLAVCACWNAPSWLVLGENGESSYSAAALPESLFLRTVGKRQRKEANYWKGLLRKVLEKHVARGDLEDQLDQVDIHLVPPSPITRNRYEEIKGDLELVMKKLMSQHTFCSKYDLDFDEEQAKIEEEPELSVSLLPDQPGSPPETSGGEYQKDFNPPKE